FEADRPVYRDGLAQRVLGKDDFHPCRLAVIPFHRVIRPVWADYAVPGGDLMPEQRGLRAWRADPSDVDGEPVSMERVEFVGETPNAECGRPVGGENSGERQSGASRLSNGAGQTIDKLRMQPADRAFGSLSRHGVARRCGLDQISARSRRP